MADNLFDQLRISKEKPKELANPFDKLKTDIEQPKIKNVGWYDEAAFDEAVKRYQKSGFHNSGKRPQDDSTEISDSRAGPNLWKDISKVGTWLDTGLKGASDLTGNLFHVPLPFLKGNNLYIKKGEKIPTKRDLWQYIRHRAGYFGPTHYLASLTQVAGETAQGAAFLGKEGISLLVDYIGEGAAAVLGGEPDDPEWSPFGKTIDTRQRFEEWLGQSTHYHFKQRPLANEITDLIWVNDREKTLEILRKHEVTPSYINKEIQEDADHEEAFHKGRGLEFDKETYIKHQTGTKSQTGKHLFRYTEADVAMLVDKLLKEYKEIALPAKETAQARQMADGILGDYTDPERLKAAIRKDPMNFVVDALDIALGTKGLTKSVRAGGKINKVLRLEKIKDWAKQKRAQTQATKPGMPYEPPKTDIPPKDTPDEASPTQRAHEASTQRIAETSPDTTTDIPDNIPSDTPGDGAERIKTEIGDKDSPSLVDDTTSPLKELELGDVGMGRRDIESKVRKILESVKPKPGDLDMFSTAPVTPEGVRMPVPTTPTRQVLPNQPAPAQITPSPEIDMNAFLQGTPPPPRTRRGTAGQLEEMTPDQLSAADEAENIIGEDFPDEIPPRGAPRGAGQLEGMTERGYDDLAPGESLIVPEVELRQRTSQNQPSNQGQRGQSLETAGQRFTDDRRELDTLRENRGTEGRVTRAEQNLAYDTAIHLAVQLGPDLPQELRSAERFDQIDDIVQQTYADTGDINQSAQAVVDYFAEGGQIESEIPRTSPDGNMIPSEGDRTPQGFEPTGKKVSIEDLEAEFGNVLDDAVDAADIELDEVDDILGSISQLLDEDGNINMQGGIGIPIDTKKIKAFFDTIKENWNISPEDLDTVIKLKLGKIDKVAAQTALESGKRTMKEAAAIANLVGRASERIKKERKPKGPKGSSRTATGAALRSVPRHFAESGSLIQGAITGPIDTFKKKYKERHDKKIAMSTRQPSRKKIYNTDAAASEAAYNIFRDLFTATGQIKKADNPKFLNEKWKEIINNTSKQKVADILKRSEHALVETATNVELENLIATVLKDKTGNLSDIGKLPIVFTNLDEVIRKFKEFHLDPARGGAQERSFGSTTDYVNRPAIKRMEGPINTFLKDINKGDITQFDKVSSSIRKILSNVEIRTNKVFKALSSVDPVKPGHVGFLTNKEWLDGRMAEAMAKNRNLADSISDADIQDFVKLVENTDDFKEYRVAENEVSITATVHDFVKLQHAINNVFEQAGGGSSGFNHEDYAEIMAAFEQDFNNFTDTVGTKGKKLVDWNSDFSAVKQRLHDANIRGIVKTVSEFSDDDKIAEFFLDPLTIDNDGLQELIAYLFEPETSKVAMPKGKEHLFEGPRRPEKTPLSTGTKPYPRIMSDKGKWTPDQLRQALKSKNIKDWTPEQQLLVFRGFLLKSMFSGLRPGPNIYTTAKAAGVIADSKAGINIHRWKEMIKSVEADSPGRGEILFGKQMWDDMKKMKSTSTLAQLFTEGAGAKGVTGAGLNYMSIAWGEWIKRIAPGKEFKRTIKTDPTGPFPYKKFMESLAKWHPGFQIASRRYEEGTDRPKKLPKLPDVGPPPKNQNLKELLQRKYK